MADQYDLSDEQKQHALVKAYERHGERIGMRAEGGVAPPSHSDRTRDRG